MNSRQYSLSQFEDHWEFREDNFLKHFDLDGRLLRIENEIGEYIDIEYDPTGNSIAEVTSPSGSLTIYFEDYFSKFTKIILPNDKKILYEYDQLGRLASVNNIGHITTYLYEDPNNPSAITNIIDPRNRTYKTISYYEDGTVWKSALSVETIQEEFTYPSTSESDVTNAFNRTSSYQFIEVK